MAGIKVTQFTRPPDPAVGTSAAAAALAAVDTHDAAADPHPQYAMLGTAIPFVESGAGAAGTATRASPVDHVHPAASGATLGTATPLVESGVGTPGTATAGSHEDHVHPASGGASFGTPTVTFGTASLAGTALTALRTDATLAAFGAAVPVTQAFSDSAAAGTAAFAARIDHRHGMPANPGGGTASGGAFVLLEQHTASGSATLDFTACISSTYDEYIFEMLNVLPATNGVYMYMRVGTGAGPTWDSGNVYAYTNLQFDTGSSGLRSSAGTSAYELANAVDNTATGGLSGFLRLFGPANGAKHPDWTLQETRLTGGVPLSGSGGGRYLSTTAITGVQFFFSSGNVASGIIRCYGIAKA